MYRRLVTFALAVVAVAVIALVIPLGLAARDIVRAHEVAEIADRSRTIADLWEESAKKSSEHESASFLIPPGEGSVTLVRADGSVIGAPVPAKAQPVVNSARNGRSASLDTGELAFAAAPAIFDDDDIAAVLVTADSTQLQEGLARRLLALFGLSAALLVAAGIAAWLMARRTAQPILELAATADAIASGNLEARADPSTITEINDVGIALNRLAERVGELLADERATTAELAHQLRTPLTVLTADIDAVSDAETRERLAEDAMALQRTTDEIINNARRPMREGVHASCDVVAVGEDRVSFWRVLAEYQGRDLTFTSDPGPLLVRLTEYDLTTAADILLQNVFVHTEEGVAFGIRIAAQDDGLVAFEVSDRGKGMTAAQQPTERTGSTNLGLSIAERLAKASGGRLARETNPGGGALVTLLLGRATR